ncbi:PAS/PAC sensor signal transduction histidine kinase [Natronoarchaeum philippinense]|uniref:histidine kinase n=1 Tax=Natronoarchaeum philippinense TaxID=558529 RepID=A0A285P4Y8_NATPI|nr:PAS domain-containing protein [Natronoarchaeum philippinense]SNZ15226.1 PAS/PAC sensor signal transduction histidine kinase [Natronoarchaeum philippinense]
MTLSAAAYRDIFEEHPDGMAVLGPETGRIHECNARFAELVDTTSEQLEGRAISTVLASPTAADGDLVGELQETEGETAYRIRTDEETDRSVAVRTSTLDGGGNERVVMRAVAAPEQAQLQELERKTRAMDEAPIGITISDLDDEDNALIYANEGFQRLTGYSKSSVVGQNCRFLQGDETSGEPVATMRDAVEANEATSVELRNYRKDGAMFWNRVTIAPVEDADGEISNYVGFQEDITERKEYEQELELAYNLLETVPSGVLRTTPSADGTFEYANPALVSLLDAESSDQLREHRVAEFYETPSERADLIDDLAETDTPVQHETTVETMTGDTKEVLITALLTEDDGGNEHIHKVVQDITTRKEYERRIKEQRDNLDILNQILRHDIRNDLQLVSAYAEMLDEHVDEAGEEQLATIRTSAANAIELTRTARDMADVMLSAEDTRREVDLRRALVTKLEETRDEHPEAEIERRESLPSATVLANDMLGSVFRNLLTNAIKHNNSDQPEVTVTATTDEETATVRVADNGPGIPDAQKDEIFGKGEKGLESEGTGIGLYLVQTLVEHYGGEVWVEDNDPEGAVFGVELPLAG